MPRDVELVQKQFGSNEPLPSIELADNALKLGGILAKMYALKTDLNAEVSVLLSNIDDVIAELREHENDDVRHLTSAQINKIQAAINATEALTIAQRSDNWCNTFYYFTSHAIRFRASRNIYRHTNR